MVERERGMMDLAANSFAFCCVLLLVDYRESVKRLDLSRNIFVMLLFFFSHKTSDPCAYNREQFTSIGTSMSS